MTGVTVVDHPLVARHLSVLRDSSTPSSDFRRRLSDISMLLLYEALRDLRVREEQLDTPLETTGGMRLADEIVVIAILRAGPRDDRRRAAADPRGARRPSRPLPRRGSLQPVGYYESVPRHASDAEVIVVDPMLATGGSAVSALNRMKQRRRRPPPLRRLVAAPEGLAAVREAHPEVPSSARRRPRARRARLHRPGLGDAGDRIFGTEVRPRSPRTARARPRPAP